MTPSSSRTYLDEKCLAAAKKKSSHAVTVGNPALGAGTISALIAPQHRPVARRSRLWARLRCGSPIVLRPMPTPSSCSGTSHAPMREPFALCNKSFDTPLGPMHADEEALAAIATHATFDPYADQLFHKREHSLEFQVVFLKHILARRKKSRKEPKIVPILAGLGHHQARGTNPEKDTTVISFLDGVRALADARGDRVVVIAGADLAHVGPRFGDIDALRREKTQRARETRRRIARASHAARRSFGILGSRFGGQRNAPRVRARADLCAAQITSCRLQKGNAEALHYEQTIDPEDGSIVSHASVAFYR